jgi:redox-sensitive bicupin YhaK (pirin superfamily)
MLQGEIRHEDSMGNGSVIRAGDVQRMTAGTGVTHSEFNASATEQAHLLQIWLLPERDNIEPGYEEKHFSPEEKQGRWRLIASRDAREGSLLIHQDVSLYAAVLAKGDSLDYDMQSGRSLYIQLARGSVNLNGQVLVAGDAAKVDTQQDIALSAIGCCLICLQ